MSIIPMKALLESGVHFGHRTHKWHPAMKPYIFTERNGIHIIDLQKTAKAFDVAYNLVRDAVAGGGTLLFVGTKRQAQDTIRDEATRCGMPYVTNRWLGGMLTNWRTMRQRINELDRLERMREKGEFALITKKEALILERKIERLESLLGGIRKMATVPDMLFVVDVHREATSIHEANLLEIPVVALVDTNCDPMSVDYVIPSNDDAIRAIKLLVGKIADAAVEGRAMRKEEEIEAMPEGAPMAITEEPELSDEELLGEATLAKLPPRGVSAEAEGELLAGEEELEATTEVEEVEAVEIFDTEEEGAVDEVEEAEEVEISETEEEAAVAEIEEDLEDSETDEEDNEDDEVVDFEELGSDEDDEADNNEDFETDEEDMDEDFGDDEDIEIEVAEDADED